MCAILIFQSSEAELVGKDTLCLPRDGTRCEEWKGFSLALLVTPFPTIEFVF